MTTIRFATLQDIAPYSHRLERRVREARGARTLFRRHGVAVGGEDAKYRRRGHAGPSGAGVPSLLSSVRRSSRVTTSGPESPSSTRKPTSLHDSAPVIRL